MLLRSTFFLRIGFQPSLSPNMDAIVEFHDYILCFLISILFFVLAIFFQIVKHSFYKLSYPETLEDIDLRESIFKARVLKHNRFLETIWTLLPMIILVFIAIPSYSLLYTTDGVYSPSITVKVVGQQWFWTYSYSDRKMGVQKKDYLYMDLSSYSLLIKNILFDEDCDPVTLKRNKKGKLSSIKVDPEKMGAFMKKLYSYGFLKYADNTRSPVKPDLTINRPMFDLYYLNFDLFESLNKAFESETINKLNDSCPIDKKDFVSYVKENPDKFIIYIKPLFDLVVANYCATTLIKIWPLTDRIQDVSLDCMLMTKKRYRPLPISLFPDYNLRPSCSPSYVLPIHLVTYAEGKEALERLSRRLRPLPTPIQYKFAKLAGFPSPFPYWLYEVIKVKDLRKRNLEKILELFSQASTELSFAKLDIQQKIRNLQIVSIKVPVIVDVYARVPFTYDSYMVPTSELKIGQPRLLTVDKPLVLPINTNIRILVSSYDVLHSFAVPSLGIKMDAVPGRLNQVGTRILHESVLRGQCSELCGVNHGFMPIEIIGVKVDKFLEWYLYKLSSNKDLFYDFSRSSNLIQMASTDNVTSLQNRISGTSFVKVAYRDFLKLCLNSESTLTTIFKKIYGTDFLGVRRESFLALKRVETVIARWQTISIFAALTGLKDFLVGPHFDPTKHTSRFAIVHHVDVNNNYQSHLFVFDRMDPDRSFKIYPRVMKSLLDENAPSSQPKIRSDVLSLFNKKIEKLEKTGVRPRPKSGKGLTLLFYPNRRKFELVFRHPNLKNHFLPEEFFVSVTIPHMGGTYVFSTWAEIVEFLRSFTYSMGVRIWSPDNASKITYPLAFYEFEYAIKRIFNLIDPDDPNIDLIDWLTPNAVVFLRERFPAIFDKVVRNITISSPIDDDGFDIHKLVRYYHLREIRYQAEERRLRIERQEIPLRALKALGKEMKDIDVPEIQRIRFHLKKTVKALEWYKH